MTPKVASVAFVMCLAALGVIAPTSTARAEIVSIGDAVTKARVHGFEVMAAKARVRGAEADVRSAGALPNPTLAIAPARRVDCWGRACEAPWGAFVTLSDEGLLEGAISRKRALREEVAGHALDAARWDARDVERLLVAQTKIQYVRAAAATVRVDFARTVARSLERTAAIDRVRYPKVIDEAQLARVENEAMRATQDFARAEGTARQERIELAYLLGDVPAGAVDLEADPNVLKFRVPEVVANVDREALERVALERPDRRAAEAEVQKGDASVREASRSRVPDIAFVASYQQLGTGLDAAQPPTVSIGISLPLPIFDRKVGPIAHAEAEREAAVVGRRRVEARIAADVAAAWEAYVTSRSIVERYESTMLARASKARDITEVQYNAGATTLTDFLDAQRTWVQVNGDYTRELVDYWTALVLLERAVGTEIVR